MVDQRAELRMDVPHSARIYDYLLGGKDNFPADRAAAAQLLRQGGDLPISMRANRNFMCRAVRHLAESAGIRQFLDIGTGLPTSPNLHEVVQEVAPQSRVVYVDNDPMVLVQARALLTSNFVGRTAYVDADVRDPETILGAPEVTRTFDFREPVAVSLIAILQFILDEQQALGIVERLMRRLAPGSALALSTVTADSAPEAVNKVTAMYTAQGIPAKARTKAEVERFFDGLELVEPGVALVNRWRPDEAAGQVEDSAVYMCGGVAIKR